VITSADTSDVIVVGGGVIGSTIALRLAERGAKVTLVDRKDSGRASIAAAGMLSPLGERHPPEFITLAQASLDLYAGFVAELTSLTGEVFEFERTGKLDVAYTSDEIEALKRSYDGVEAEWLNRKEAHQREPALNPAMVRAVWRHRAHAHGARARRSARGGQAAEQHERRGGGGRVECEARATAAHAADHPGARPDDRAPRASAPAQSLAAVAALLPDTTRRRSRSGWRDG
jgi:glycine/D-amino acid oxidase-like deaminating enzyme